MIRLAVLAALLGLSVMSPALAEPKTHRVAIQVSENDPARMNLALNNAVNIVKTYQDRKEMVEVRIITYGPGVTLVRSDTSPLATRVKSFVEGVPEVSFDVCDNTLVNLRKTEGKEIPILDGVKHVEAGAVTLMDLQEQGWSYIRP
ncbi:hypothetical protein CU669_05635 [Paramagnetospirillum kuznetsovii]|uniref:Uncharacterized protein n=1 Tax=Paramagnetospirillum kuznetsovii TaxID=2053833 RepID=A0A364P0L6_9PROT|nr:DsrE family protein [Paramagnetospirillum kuznetsovii]RAU22864.1 hypothetical protein CU669_05635 [Paramagnetospirillum kuznetsovii]